MALVLCATAASAHDFWLEPSTFHPRLGESVTVSLRVGQDFIGDVVPRSAQLIDTFVVRERGAEHPVNGFEGQDPAGYLRFDQPGLAIVGYRSKPYPLELPAPKFEEFLHTEGFDAILAQRRARNESQKPDHERFFRYAKALLVSGDGDDRGFDKPLGFRYELIPETSPATANHLIVRALFENKPLAGALVTAIEQDHPDVRFSARTDRQGRVTFDLPRGGVWLVKSVHMIAAPPGSGVDWESLWASLTFAR